MYQAYAYELLNQKEAMKGAPDHPLYHATERLLAALGRLESNLEVASDQLYGELATTRKENGELREERASLNAAVAQLQHQYDDLHRVASAIYQKLEISIKRLSTLIEE